MAAPPSQPGSKEYKDMCANFALLRRKYDMLKRYNSELIWSDEVCTANGILKQLPQMTNERVVETLEEVNGIELGKILGEGSFSSVYEGKSRRDGRPCALKRIKKSGVKSVNELKNIAAEHDALASLSGGPNMLELQGSFATAENLYFVMEHFGVELYAHMKMHPTGLPREFAAAVVYSVANALAYMHGLGFVHRDIKPENVLVEVQGYSFQDVLVKLCDLGLCARLAAVVKEEKESSLFDPEAEVGRPENQPMFQCCGSMGFFAPEMLSAEGYDGARADMWSLGCLALEASIGSNVFATFWFYQYKEYFSAERQTREFHEVLASAVEAISEAAKAKKLEAKIQAQRRASSRPDAESSDDAASPPTTAKEPDPASSPVQESSSVLQQKLDNACAVSALVAACLTFDAAARPRAFEARDILSACRYAGQRQSMGGSQFASPTLALNNLEVRVADKVRSDRGRYDFSALKKKEEEEAQTMDSPSSPRSMMMLMMQTSSSSVNGSGEQLLVPAGGHIQPPSSPSPTMASGGRTLSLGGGNASAWTNNMTNNMGMPSIDESALNLTTSKVTAAVRSGGAPSLLPQIRGTTHPTAPSLLLSPPSLFNKPPDETESPVVRAKAATFGAPASSPSGTKGFTSSTFSRHRVLSEEVVHCSSSTEEEEEEEKDPNRPPRILIVDDSPTSLRMTALAVKRKFPYEIHTANSAMVALELAAVNQFDIVVTDVIMPFMDGFQLVAALRSKAHESDPRLFICALTQMADTFDVAPHLDVDVVLCKPLDVEVLAAKLHTTIALSITPQRTASSPT